MRMDKPKRILIVEDDGDIAELLQLHLRDEGYAISHAADGNRGMAMLGCGWDALILDLMLPGVDGLEICRRARTMTRYTPIIITSARSSGCTACWGWSWAPTTIWPSPSPCWSWWRGSKRCFAAEEAMSRNLRMDAGVLSFNDLTIDPLPAKCTCISSRSS